MNILQVQDRLKDLSDQQLAREMSNPTGAAPQYLVLTELQRRKKMRESAAPQQSGPQPSMAEEAVAGIATLAPPEEDAAPAMASGGVVRMAGGGDVSSMSVDELRRLLDDMSDPRFRSRAAMPDVSPDAVRTILQEKMDQEDAAYRSGPRTGFSRDINAAANAVASGAGAVGQGIADVGSGVASGIGAVGRGVRDYFTQPTLQSQEGVPPVVDVSPTPRDYDDKNPGPSDPSIPTPPAYVSEGQARQQAGARSGGGGGGGGIASTGVPNPAAAAAAPQQQEGSDYINELRKELAASRGEAEKDRSEAKSMALIEAGLRIAASQSPHFAAALGEAAPAVQSYAKANSDIRRNDRENRQLQIALEKEATNDKYREGMLDYYNKTLGLKEKEIAAMAARAGGRGSGMTFAEYAAMPEEQRALADRYLGKGNDREAQRDVMLAGRISQAMNTDPILKKLTGQLEYMDPSDPKSRPTYDRIRQLYNERATEIRSSIYSDAGRSGPSVISFSALGQPAQPGQ